MMWTVVWKPSAQQDLATIWLATVDRNAVTGATHWIDRVLATNPETTGAVVFDTVRICEVPPLGVEFEILDQDRVVWVLGVWDSTKTFSP